MSKQTLNQILDATVIVIGLMLTTENFWLGILVMILGYVLLFKDLTALR